MCETKFLDDCSREWHSICFGFQNATRKFRLVINGDLLFTDDVKGSVSVSPELLKNLQILSHPYRAENQRFKGKLTQLNVWNISLDNDSMISWTSCKDNHEGNLLAWDTVNWKLEGIMSTILCRNE